MLDKKLLGAKLRLARLKLNMSQYDLERLADVDQRLITRYENGISFPKLDSFLKLINALEIDVKEILNQNGICDSPYTKLIQDISYLTPKQIKFIENVVRELIPIDLK